MQTKKGDDMKKIMLLLAALFPFLHATPYEVHIQSCQKEGIVAESEGSKLSLSLFNIRIKNDSGWKKTCSLLEDAEHVTMEVDPSTQITENLSVYLFADGQLLQEELLAKGMAYLLIRNPEYTYEKRMEKAEMQTTQTMAKPVIEKKHQSYPLQGPVFLGICVLLWMGMLLVYGIHKKKKKTFARKKI